MYDVYLLLSSFLFVDELVHSIREAESCSKELNTRIADSALTVSTLAENVESLAKIVRKEQNEVKRLFFVALN